MKTLTASLILASSLFAATGIFLFLRLRSAESGPGAEASEARGAALAAVESRLEKMEARLVDLEDAYRARQGAPRAAESAAEDEEATGHAKTASAAKQTLDVALAAAGKDADDLRGLVRQVIVEERESRKAEEKRKSEEAQREWQALAQGPYGNYNRRVNTLGKNLNLNDRQKERYYALLTDYAARFEEARKTVDRNDADGYKSYQERKKAWKDEFNTLFLQNLSIPQAEAYQKLADSEKSPDPKTIDGSIMSISLGDGETTDLRAVHFSTAVGAEGIDFLRPGAAGVTVVPSGGEAALPLTGAVPAPGGGAQVLFENLKQTVKKAEDAAAAQK